MYAPTKYVLALGFGLFLLAGRDGAAQTAPATAPASAPASAPATTQTAAASAPTSAPETRPSPAPESRPATAPALPVLRLHVPAIADDPAGRPNQLSGPPPQIIRVTFPPQLAARWAGALTPDQDLMLKNAAFDLRPTADGLFRQDQGIMGIYAAKGAEVKGYEISFENVTAAAPTAETRRYTAHVTVKILPEQRLSFDLEVIFNVTPPKWAGGPPDAVDANVAWTGPIPPAAPPAPAAPAPPAATNASQPQPTTAPTTQPSR